MPKSTVQQKNDPQFQLHTLVNHDRQSKKRLGRGTGSGLGTTAGRGTKGQNSRSGGGVRPRFEGGHTPLYRLLPKLRGYRSQFRKLAVVNVEQINVHFADNDVVSLKTLAAKGLCHSTAAGVKVLGQGEISKKVIVYADSVSASAKMKIEKAGGKIHLPAKKPAQVKKSLTSKKPLSSHVQKDIPSA